MYLIDTNVLSEFRKGKKSSRNVAAWASQISVPALFLSVISILELEQGILKKERQDPTQGAILRTWLNSHVLPVFSERILDVDIAIAQRCARLHIPDPKSERDVLIAATALVHGLVMVTRNVDDFIYADLEVCNPWDYT